MGIILSGNVREEDLLVVCDSCLLEKLSPVLEVHSIFGEKHLLGCSDTSYADIEIEFTPQPLALACKLIKKRTAYVSRSEKTYGKSLCREEER